MPLHVGRYLQHLHRVASRDRWYRSSCGRVGGAVNVSTLPVELANVSRFIGNRAGTYRFPCVVCDRGERDRACAFTVEPDGGYVGLCHRCGWTISSRGSVERTPRPIALKARGPSKAPDTAMALYAASRRISAADPAGTYLQARGCVLPPADGDLRWHPQVRHPSGHVGPALVARITHAITGEPMSVHRTWIDPGRPGKKAEVDPPRMYWSGLPTKHGVVRLWPDESVSTGLGIGEGIETCLALAHAYAPVWACLDAGHVADCPLLLGIEALVIAADHDDAGIKAAKSCATRWVSHGIEVAIVMSQYPGRDVADEVLA